MLPDATIDRVHSDPHYALAFARIENRYFVNNGFLEDQQLLRDASKLKGLEWQCVDLERKHAWIPGSKHKNGSPHSVPLNEMALSVLRKQIGKHPTRVFTFKGEPVANVYTKAFKAALERAGIEDFNWHDLRHTFATWHRQAGTPTHELQRLGGLEDRGDGRAVRTLGPGSIAGGGESARCIRRLRNGYAE